MAEEIRLHHIAVNCSDRKKAERFFTKILEIPKVKTFDLSADLSDKIFGIRRSVTVDVYDNGVSRFEVFITDTGSTRGYDHMCVVVNNREAFLRRCKTYGVEPLVLEKNGKTLVFVKDFAGNLYEVKET